MTLTEEHPSDELQGSALDVIGRQFELMTGSPREKVSLISLRAVRLGRWVCLTVQFRGRVENEVVIRMSAVWATRLRDQLVKALPLSKDEAA